MHFTNNHACIFILILSVYIFLLQNSISSSKLSATVPAFVPGITYTGPTSPNNLVINSNLSPLVPEFKPSVAFTSYAFPPYEPVHNLHYQYHGKQLYVAKQENIEQQVSHQEFYIQMLS